MHNSIIKGMILLLVIIILAPGTIQNQFDGSCLSEDWTQFKDSKCFKIIRVLISGTELNATCSKLGEGFKSVAPHPIPAIIHANSEENTFVGNMLAEEFNRGTKDESEKSVVWLGAKIEYFQNNGQGQDDENKCLIMDETGGLTTDFCQEKHYVLCETTQMWTKRKLQNVILEMKENFENTGMTPMKGGSGGKSNVNVTILENELKEAIHKMDLMSTKMFGLSIQLMKLQQEANGRINNLTEQLNHSMSAMSNDSTASNKLLLSDMESAKTAISSLSTELNNAKAKITVLETEKNSIPIGFIYVQLPGKQSPATLWPRYGWTQKTSEFAGLFFRAEGGDSAGFGTLQTGTSPRLYQVKYHDDPDSEISDLITTTVGSWSSNAVYNGLYDSGRSNKDKMGMKFYISGDEVRPKNKAVRIWERTS